MKLYEKFFQKRRTQVPTLKTSVLSTKVFKSLTLRHVIMKILKHLEEKLKSHFAKSNGQFSIIVFLDWSVAFDTIDDFLFLKCVCHVSSMTLCSHFLFVPSLSLPPFSLLLHPPHIPEFSALTGPCDLSLVISSKLMALSGSIHWGLQHHISSPDIPGSLHSHIQLSIVMSTQIMMGCENSPRSEWNPWLHRSRPAS